MNLRDLIKQAAKAKMTPLPHQERFKTKFVAPQKPGQRGVIALHDTGTGKSFTSIHAAQATGKPLIAIVPAALRENYKKELEAAGHEGETTVISYHQAMKLKDDPEFRAKAKDSVVVYDEAHNAGRADSARSKLFKEIKSYKNMPLTGTPIRNHPTELVPLLQAVTDDPTVTSVDEFKKNYIEDGVIKPSFLARIRGAKAQAVERPKNLEQLAGILKDVVDVQKRSGSAADMPSVSEERVEVPLSGAQRRAYDAVMAGNPGFAYNLRNGIPPERKDWSKYRAFLTGLRQISNTPAEFATKAGPKDAAKIMRAADEIEARMSKSKDYKGYSYSNYIGSGLKPLQDELNRRGIPSAAFTGKLNDKERKALVNQYNKGELKHLLLSSSGAEGLDLKGTRLVQILDPHFHNSKINQVKARGIRYKSHAHLPDTDRNVHVQKFTATVPQHPLHKMLGLKRQTSAEEQILEMAKTKDTLNNAFLKVLDKVQNSG